MEIKLTIGGVGREEILARLQRQGIQLNDYARQWLDHPGFHLLDPPQTVTLRILELGALGCAGGATLPQIFRLAARNGLSPCAPETALFPAACFGCAAAEHKFRSFRHTPFPAGCDRRRFGTSLRR